MDMSLNVKCEAIVYIIGIWILVEVLFKVLPLMFSKLDKWWAE